MSVGPQGDSVHGEVVLLQQLRQLRPRHHLVLGRQLADGHQLVAWGQRGHGAGEYGAHGGPPVRVQGRGVLVGPIGRWSYHDRPRSQL